MTSRLLDIALWLGGFLILYWVIRNGVRGGIRDADRERERSMRDAKRRGVD